MNRDYIHPGIILQKNLDDHGMSQRYLAWAIGYSTKHINQVVKGKVRITPEMALRLESEQIGSARFWVRQQADHDLYLARKDARTTPSAPTSAGRGRSWALVLDSVCAVCDNLEAPPRRRLS